MPGKPSEPIQIYQLKITLQGSNPPVWRRIQVESHITVAQLHRILQAVMGWKELHLHRFLIRGEPYGIPNEGKTGFSRTRDERRYKLETVGLGTNSRFSYTYDFGDAWEHELLVEDILPPKEGGRYPTCLEGARACPPEDVGGVPGYENFLDAMHNPDHPDHEEYLEWVGRPFDPEAFDVNEINRKLRRIK